MAIARNIRTVCPTPVPERTHFEYGARLTKPDGTAFVAADFLSLTVTVYDLGTDTLINGIDAESILNTGRGELDGSGRLTVNLERLDLALVNDALPYERHIMLIEGLYAGGARGFVKEVEHVVVERSRVP